MVGCYIWYIEEGPGRAAALPSPLIAVPNVTAHLSTANVPITVLLYDGPLLCGFNVAINGLSSRFAVGLYAKALSFCLCICLFVRLSVAGACNAYTAVGSGSLWRRPRSDRSL